MVSGVTVLQEMDARLADAQREAPLRRGKPTASPRGARACARRRRRRCANWRACG